MSKASYLEKLGEPRELDGLHVELREDGVHGAVVVDLGLEADELERRLGHLEDGEGVRLGHLLHLKPGEQTGYTMLPTGRNWYYLVTPSTTWSLLVPAGHIHTF